MLRDWIAALDACDARQIAFCPDNTRPALALILRIDKS
jgi:hypothetical protein